VPLKNARVRGAQVLDPGVGAPAKKPGLLARQQVEKGGAERLIIERRFLPERLLGPHQKGVLVPSLLVEITAAAGCEPLRLEVGVSREKQSLEPLERFPVEAASFALIPVKNLEQLSLARGADAEDRLRESHISKIGGRSMAETTGQIGM